MRKAGRRLRSLGVGAAALLSLSAMAVCVAYAGAASSAGSTPPATLSSALQKREFVPGELIVRFKPGLRPSARASILREEGATLRKQLPLPGAAVVRLPAGAAPVAAAARDFERRADVLYAEPNYLFRVAARPYSNDSASYLDQTNSLNLTGQSGCSAEYQLNLATEPDFDFFTLYGSLDGANWSLVDAWSGSSQGTFVPLSSDLSAFDGRPSVFLRLGLESDESIVDDGAYVDDLTVRCLNAVADAYGVLNGTSMATPHAAGVAALALAENPALSTAELKSRLLGAVDPLPQLNGIVSTSGRLNACKAVTACTSGSPPVPQTPNDPLYSQLWGLNQASDADIDAPEAWGTQTGNENVRVAVVDSGVAYQHPDIAPNMWSGIGFDFIEGDATPYDYSGHGTHVAGTIGAQGHNGLGMNGVNWNVSIMALRAGDASGSLPTSAIVQAFAYACSNDARIVNGSFGGDAAQQSMYDAIVACPTTLFVVAAGNDGADNDLAPQYPCNYHRPGSYGAGAPNLVCIAATGQTDQRAGFSNFGAQSVHLAAPGQGILSSVPAYHYVSGEDFEAPLPGRWQPRVISGLPWGQTSEYKASGTFSVADSRDVAPPPPPGPPPPTLPPPPPTVRPPTPVLRCVVPNVKRKTVAQARRLLVSKRCRLGRVTRAYSARVRTGRIIRQSRRPGVRLARGTKVKVVVSRGKRRR